jgi:hypothetical protein
MHRRTTVRHVTDSSDLINLLAAAEAAATAARGGGTVAGEGVAADGLIVVHTGLPGRVTGIYLDPGVAGMSLEDLAAELTSAVNASLADLQSQAGVPSEAVDLDALGGRLRDLQERTSRQFSAFADSLVEAQAALARRAGEPR